MTPQERMGSFFEWATMAIVIWGLWLFARRLLRPLRPLTARELEARPRSFFARVQPVVDSLPSEPNRESRADIKRDATVAFAGGLAEHRLSLEEFALVFVMDEIEGEVAMVRRNSDGKVWRLNDFDDYLFTRRTV